MTQPIPKEAPLLPNGQLTISWRQYFQSISIGAAGGTVTSVSITPANGITGTVGTPSTTPAITLALGAITPTSVAASGALSGSNLALGGKLTTAAAVTLSGAFASTFTLTGVTTVTFPTSGTLATVAATVATGGSVTQATSKSTGVTLNSRTGQITTANDALGTGVTATFTLTNSTIAAKDIVLLQLQSGNANPGTYLLTAEASGAGSVKIDIRNIDVGSLSEALVIGFAVVKAVIA